MSRADNFIDKINYIIDFFVDPCDAPITVYAELALPALIDALLTYFEFQPDEILIQRFRTSAAPNLKRSDRKGKRGSKAGRNKFTKAAGKIINFDPNESVGKKLGKYGKLPRVLTGRKAFLWIVEGALERLAFYIFLAELLIDFFYSWFSLLNRSIYCQKESDTVLFASNEHDEFAAIIGWNPMAFENIEKIRGEIAWNVFTGAFTGKNLTVMFGGGYRQFPPGIQDTFIETSLRVQFPGNPTVYRYAMGSGKVGNVAAQEIAGTVKLKGPCSFAPELACDYGFVVSDGQTFSAHGPLNEPEGV